MGAVVSLVGDGLLAASDVAKAVAALIGKYNALLARASSDPGLPVPHPTSPYWLVDPPYPALADVQSETLSREADVVIIGSGITAAAAAKSLLEVSASASTLTPPPLPPPPRRTHRCASSSSRPASCAAARRGAMAGTSSVLPTRSLRASAAGWARSGRVTWCASR